MAGGASSSSSAAPAPFAIPLGGPSFPEAADASSAPLPKPTFVDLLTQGKKNAKGDGYEKWVLRLQEMNEKTFEKRLVCAMVSSLHFATFRGKAGLAPASLPNEVVGLVLEFIGTVMPSNDTQERAFSVNHSTKLAKLSDMQRGRDWKRAADYLVTLARESAASTGAGSFAITAEIAASMPKMSDGSAPQLKQIFEILSSWGHFDITDANGEEFYTMRDDRGRNTHVGRIGDDTEFVDGFPYKLIWDIQEPLEVDGEDARDLVEQLEAGNGVYGALPGIPAGNCNAAAGSRFFQKFRNVVIETQKKVLKYLLDIFEEAVSKANTEIQLTEEQYNGAPKLPNGKRYPFFQNDVADLHVQLDRSDFAMSKILAQTPGLYVPLAQRELGAFPITIRLIFE
ncbi:unnamed protein product [Amoebophrya sp. A120]|nr:unnamed protein product [Amoebophrya sp. A120]|eukprot:GSA120T00005779001.1